MKILRIETQEIASLRFRIDEHSSRPAESLGNIQVEVVFDEIQNSRARSKGDDFPSPKKDWKTLFGWGFKSNQ